MLVLLHGPDEFLSDRGAADAVAAARQTDPDLEITEIDASASDASLRIAEAGSADLFGTRHVLVLHNADAMSAGVCQQALDSATDSPVIAHHRGGNRGPAILKELKKHAGATVACQAIKKGRALNDFVLAEFRRHGRRIAGDAMALLIEAVGTDLADLSAAASQLCADTDENPISAATVTTYFRGVAEISGYQIADAVINRNTADVLRRLRQAQVAADGARTGPAIVAAVASQLRQLIAFSTCPPGMSEADIAKAVSVPPWRIRSLRTQSRKWTTSQLAAGIVTMAALDAKVKGGLREGQQLDSAQKLQALEHHLVDLASG